MAGTTSTQGEPQADLAGDALERLRFPVGRFQPKDGLSAEERGAMIRTIMDLPDRFRAAVSGLSTEQLDTPYRPGGWTVRQVAHHVPESHMNAYIRFKLALTEDDPQIKPYEQQLWAELPDARTLDVEASLALLDALHRRWAYFLGLMEPEAFARTFRHPEMGAMTLERTLQLYAWHSRHHLAHVTGLRERMGW